MELKFEVTELGRFLQDELTISSAEIALVVQKHQELNARATQASPGEGEDATLPIPMLLWQYGLVSRSGLDRIFDWLETR